LGIVDAAHDRGKQRESASDEDYEGNYTWTGSCRASQDSSLSTLDKTATGATTADTTSTTSSSTKNPFKLYRDYRSRSRDLHRKHRGLMQW
jgi:hypothetical protein